MHQLSSTLHHNFDRMNTYTCWRCIQVDLFLCPTVLCKIDPLMSCGQVVSGNLQSLLASRMIEHTCVLQRLLYTGSDGDCCFRLQTVPAVSTNAAAYTPAKAERATPHWTHLVLLWNHICGSKSSTNLSVLKTCNCLSTKFVLGRPSGNHHCKRWKRKTLEGTFHSSSFQSVHKWQPLEAACCHWFPTEVDGILALPCRTWNVDLQTCFVVLLKRATYFWR